MARQNRVTPFGDSPPAGSDLRARAIDSNRNIDTFYDDTEVRRAVRQVAPRARVDDDEESPP